MEAARLIQELGALETCDIISPLEIFPPLLRQIDTHPASYMSGRNGLLHSASVFIKTDSLVCSSHQFC